MTTRKTETNVSNRTLFTNDNLKVLRRIDGDCVDLIVLDPPFNKNQMFATNKARFRDIWTPKDVDQHWLYEIDAEAPEASAVARAAGHVHGPSMKSYLLFMAVRLIQMRRVLKPTGSIWIHCDHTANSYIRMLMDAIFGPGNMRNEIVWCYTGPGNVQKTFRRKHDTLFWYTKGNEWTFNRDAVLVPYAEESMKRMGRATHSAGLTGATHERRSPEEVESLFGGGKLPESWWANEPGMGSGGQISKKERRKWPTQKPLALLSRIIKACSNPGDVVLDPFCGCATACVAAEQLGRRWIGIDQEEYSKTEVEERMRDEGVDGFGTIKFLEVPGPRTNRDKAWPKSQRKARLLARDGCKCAYCRRELALEFLEIDHVVPQSRDGDDHQDNWKLACRKCNGAKGTMSEAAFKAKLEGRDAQFLLSIDAGTKSETEYTDREREEPAPATTGEEPTTEEE